MYSATIATIVQSAIQNHVMANVFSFFFTESCFIRLVQHSLLPFSIQQQQHVLYEIHLICCPLARSQSTNQGSAADHMTNQDETQCKEYTSVHGESFDDFIFLIYGVHIMGLTWLMWPLLDFHCSVDACFYETVNTPKEAGIGTVHIFCLPFNMEK